MALRSPRGCPVSWTYSFLHGAVAARFPPGHQDQSPRQDRHSLPYLWNQRWEPKVAGNGLSVQLNSSLMCLLVEAFLSLEQEPRDQHSLRTWGHCLSPARCCRPGSAVTESSKGHSPILSGLLLQDDGEHGKTNKFHEQYEKSLASNIQRGPLGIVPLFWLWKGPDATSYFLLEKGSLDLSHTTRPQTPRISVRWNAPEFLLNLFPILKQVSYH